MQDNIPDELIHAFERHYDCSWNNPGMRTERLAWRAAWAEAVEAKQYLLQIREPRDSKRHAWGIVEKERFLTTGSHVVAQAWREAGLNVIEMAETNLKRTITYACPICAGSLESQP